MSAKLLHFFQGRGFTELREGRFQTFSLVDCGVCKTPLSYHPITVTTSRQTLVDNNLNEIPQPPSAHKLTAHDPFLCDTHFNEAHGLEIIEGVLC